MNFVSGQSGNNAACMSRFRKFEILRGKRTVSFLFESGKTVSRYPFRLIWQQREESSCKTPARVLISVPRKNFRKAHERNLVRRRIREAYRHLKTSFYERLATQNRNIDIALIYTGKDIISYHEIFNHIEKLLSMVIQQLEKRI